MLANERRVRSDGVELAVREAGDRDRPTVVLVHGYPDTSALWTPVVQRSSVVGRRASARMIPSPTAR